MPDTAPLVTAAEISRLAGVTRATVSNWRRRHPDFPAPAGGSESRPVFDLGDVRSWLREHGVESADSPLRELRTLLRAQVAPQDIPRLLDELAAAGDGKSARGDSEILRTMRAAVADAGIAQTVEALAERGLEEGPTTGVYRTPDAVAELMAELARSGADVAIGRVLDPACGSGSLLAAAARIGARACFGQDILAVQAQRAAILLSVYAPDTEVTVRSGDSLLADAFPGVDVDVVLSNPPYQQRDWGADELSLDPRWKYGVPARGESELAWVQHVLAHVRPGGTGVLLLPPAVASRGSGRRIRGELLRQGALRAVIGLPAGAAPPRQLGLHLWVLRGPDGSGAADVLFIDATTHDSAVDHAGEWKELSETIAESWRAFDRGDIESAATADVAAVVRVMDVLDEDVDLTPGRYVRAAVDAARTVDAVETTVVELAGDIAALRGAFDELPELTGVEERAWRTATVADLDKGGALRVLAYRSREEAGPVAESDLGRPVLTGRDLVTGAPPSGMVDAEWSGSVVVVEAGDVVIPQLRGTRDGQLGARVAGSGDAGAVLGPNVFLLRPDPTRVDPWFLAGFAAGPDNAAAMVGATTIRVIPSRLRIPLLPMDQQQRYGAAFRQLHRLRTTARRADATAGRLTELITAGLTVGALEPQQHSADTAETDSRKGRK
ncbi:N-6 DNA methylase [Nocardia cyriacigeorgica]|uniref:N-6 DNA methylase n=1 Tax=Nocardia cyriacigeorgica TaxID=135487 RepID=UPI001892EA51|nr:N-6 DNA methylase [Nocardia cyriacigeorgica]MBF6088905.1 N-6 DNA methylase [Nocardia cyriacigeorgica]MBF6093483.1 N-6 DNA methylase [Nocardia cyriacigeorgica]MBF6398515.1 N-6 DNA methylase [Nocardia cyriacigeorgica]MBF6403971.1 N-6 DNA methylase [Nocardia cyriacigeorgica]